jgi:two-component system, NtrC family, response regulator
MILIIDDDNAVLISLKLLLKKEFGEVVTCKSPEEGLELIKKNNFMLVLLDMNFSSNTTGREGLETLKKIKVAKPAVPVVLMTGWGNINLAVEGMKNGASDFISKPWDNQALLHSLNTIISLREAGSPTNLSRIQIDRKYKLENIVSTDPEFLKVLETVGRISGTDAPVLIQGESGTGKELIAEAIHRNSKRSEQPFIKVNLGGISSSLFESEMFGHKKGAFTDAFFDRKGRFEMAGGGTIFLDEIGELDLNSQVKLLRVLQDKTYEVLGDSNTRKLDVRVICATNRPLKRMIATRQFREDLYYRINLINITLPSLRERPSDIPVLVMHFLDNIRKSYGFKNLTLTERAMKWIKNLHFPGNVRELKNLLECTVLMNNVEQLDIEHFNYNPDNRNSSSGAFSISSMTIDDMEKHMIQFNMNLFSNSVSKAAKNLGLSRGALYRRLDKYGISYDIEE